MNNDKVVLKDGTEIALESSQGIGALRIAVNSKQEACALWERFTSDNLKQVAIKNQDGLTIGRYQDMVLSHFQGEERGDGSVLATFGLRSKTALELMEERISAVEAGQQVQDAGIDDLGQAMSDLMEGGVN